MPISDRTCLILATVSIGAAIYFIKKATDLRQETEELNKQTRRQLIDNQYNSQTRIDREYSEIVTRLGEDK